MESSLLTCSANQWTGFYIIGTSTEKELTITEAYPELPQTYNVKWYEAIVDG